MLGKKQDNLSLALRYGLAIVRSVLLVELASPIDIGLHWFANAEGQALHLEFDVPQVYVVIA